MNEHDPIIDLSDDEAFAEAAGLVGDLNKLDKVEVTEIFSNETGDASAAITSDDK